MACGVAPAGRRDRAGAAAPWAASGRGTSWVAAAGSTSSWRSVAAVLVACRRDGDGMAVTCPVAPGGFQHRDRSADVAIFAVSGTSETVAADQTRSWHLLAAVLATRPRKEGADHW